MSSVKVLDTLPAAVHSHVCSFLDQYDYTVMLRTSHANARLAQPDAGHPQRLMLHVASLSTPIPRSLTALRPRQLVLGGGGGRYQKAILPALFTEGLCHSLRTLRLPDVTSLYACTFTFPNLTELVIDGSLNIITFRILVKVIARILPALLSLTIVGDASVTQLTDIVAVAPNLQCLRAQIEPIAHDDLRTLVAYEALQSYEMLIVFDCKNMVLLQTIAHRVHALQLVRTTEPLCECRSDGETCQQHARPTLDAFTQLHTLRLDITSCDILLTPHLRSTLQTLDLLSRAPFFVSEPSILNCISACTSLTELHLPSLQLDDKEFSDFLTRLSPRLAKLGVVVDSIVQLKALSALHELVSLDAIVTGEAVAPDPVTCLPTLPQLQDIRYTLVVGPYRHDREWTDVLRSALPPFFSRMDLRHLAVRQRLYPNNARFTISNSFVNH
jgi:hypothetical protein